MRRLLYIFISMLAFLACSGGKGTPEEEALKAAKMYYDCLLAGEYDKFVDGINGIEGKPDDYKRQLQGSAKMFVDVHKKRNGGIVAVTAVRAERDSVAGCTYAYLRFTLGDSLNEQVVVQMVEEKGVWKMK